MPGTLTEDQPIYRALAHAVEAAIDNGELAAGERLPPQRIVAERLGIALTTVTRAYVELERRGLVRGEVGRGTFVRTLRTQSRDGAEMPAGAIDLRTNILLPVTEAPRMLEALARRLSAADPWTLFGYSPAQGLTAHRTAAAKYLASMGMPAEPDRLLLTCGAQHAMAVVFGTITQPGDTVIVEDHTYSGMKSLAGLLRLRLRGVPVDSEGVIPDGLRDACRESGSRAFYTMPTLHNPLCATMSEERRRAVASVLSEHAVVAVEDDSYGFLLPGLTPLSALVPGSYYIAAMSKSLLPSLRVGFLYAPVDRVGRLGATLGATTSMVPTLMSEAVAGWIEDGTVARVVEWKRAEVARRQAAALRILAGADYITHASSAHGWLRLPEPWTARDFAVQAAARGVYVTPGEEFAVSRQNPEHAVRIAVGPVPSLAVLERAVRILADLLTEGYSPAPVVV
jgi:DNA-binding transcriptional MocR family regulator